MAQSLTTALLIAVPLAAYVVQRAERDLTCATTSMENGRTMEAREGRAKQRYGPNGERLVAGIVPLSADKTQVLLISSTSRTAWVLPKGGWETDESNEQEAACREAWEEAGIEVKVHQDLGLINDWRKPEEVTKHAPRAAYRFFEASVEKVEKEWPEMHKRTRQWMTYTQAAQALEKRPELLEALNRCSISR